MSKPRCCFLAVFLLCAAAMLPARGDREQESNDTVVVEETVVMEDNVFVQVTGTVRLVGSANFPQIVISGSGSQWYVVREEMNTLYDLQHRIVTVEAEETVRELTFANGRSAGIRRELRNIRIINIEEYTGP
jgi:predicted Zn-dependent protease